MQIIKIENTNERANVCRKILNSLPDWFGLPEANLQYEKDVLQMPMWAILNNDNVIGFCSINYHTKNVAEIHVMGILKEYHQQGFGKLILNQIENELFEKGYKYLSVKTLSEARSDENYNKTRKFYLKYGFTPVEEFKTLWGEYNPCLFLIKNVEKKHRLFDKIAAVMIHVPDLEAGLDWYQKAFVEAKRNKLSEFNFELLDLNGVLIEIVNSDQKVSHGASGSVVYWSVADFEATKNHLEKLGATLYRGPMNIEDGKRMCQMKDPFGNLIGIRGK